MKIIVDDIMPKATTLFKTLGEVVAVPGRPFNKTYLENANALMVRSVTPVNADLLADTPVKFLGTATAGMDHLEVESLEKSGIYVTSAAGCNAIAVVEYVFSCLFYFSHQQQFNLEEKTIGIVGVGNVGSILDKRLKALGINVLLCDPPRARLEKMQGNTLDFIDFDTLLEKADIISFHTPLIKGTEDNTFHLLDKDKLASLANSKILINASRGEVIDNNALLEELKKGKKWSVALDVFENEPGINVELLSYIDIATPHIAGHTLEGKLRGTTILVEKYAQYLAKNHPDLFEKERLETIKAIRSDDLLAQSLPRAEILEVTLADKLDLTTLNRISQLLYDVMQDDKKFRYQIGLIDSKNDDLISKTFDLQRKNYQMRREWSSLKVLTSDEVLKKQLHLLGFKVE